MSKDTGRNSRHKMTKDIVPEDFTLGLAAVDAIPVIFFGMSFVLLGLKLKNILFLTGALLCLFAGICKVVWKIIVVLQKKNIWWLFLQLRILLPVGFLIMLAAFFIRLPVLDEPAIRSAVLAFPEVIFFVLGLFGMLLMCVFRIVLEGSDLRSNWIEQLTNSFAQICFFIGILLC